MKKLALMILVACGGGSGGSFGTGPVSQAQAEDICTAECQHDIDCGNETDPLAACVADCAADMVGWARADAVEEVFTCSAALECNASDDECLLGVQPLAIHDEWETACRADLGACFDTPEETDSLCEVSAGSDDIGFIRFIAPAIIEEMLDCVDGSDCNTQLTCLQAVFESHNIDF